MNELKMPMQLPQLLFAVPYFPSCRATLCLLGFGGGFVFYLMRSNISVAVVCMTTPEYNVIAEWPDRPHWGGDTKHRFTDGSTYTNETDKRGCSELEGLYTVFRRRRCAELREHPPNGRVSCDVLF